MNFQLGWEFELFSHYRDYEIEDDLRKMFGSLSSRFDIVKDVSLKSDRSTKGMKAWEIITPPLPEEKSFEIYDRFICYMNETDCRTNKTTGLHINLSIKNKQLMQKMDPRIVIASTDDLYLAKIFKREKNDYCQPWPDVIQMLEYERLKANRKNNTWRKYNLQREFDEMITLMYSNVWGYYKTSENDEVITSLQTKLESAKYTSVNVGKLSDNSYVEYRMIGGKDYHKNNFDVREVVEHFKIGQLRALIPENSNIIPSYLEWAQEVKI